MKVEIKHNRAALLVGAALAGAKLPRGGEGSSKAEVLVSLAAVAAASAYVSHIDGDSKASIVAAALMASATMVGGAGAAYLATEEASIQGGLAVAGIFALAAACAIK